MATFKEFEEVPRRSWQSFGLTEKERRLKFREYLLDTSSTPVIIINAPIAESPDLSIDKIVEIAGDVVVPISLVNEEKEGSLVKMMTFREYVELLRTPAPEREFTPYAKQNSALVDFLRERGFLGEVDNILCERFKYNESYMWIGAKNSFTGMHNDDEHSILTQLSGDKDVVMFPPENAPYVYINDVYDSGTKCCSADPLEKNALTKHPLLRKATPWRCTIRKGEQLLIPRFWWHRIGCITESVSINTFTSDFMALIREGIKRNFMDFLHNKCGYKKGKCACCTRARL